VADGDTITLLDADKVQHKIWLTGIDAPEKNRRLATIPKSHCLTWC
jgi:endonuclease YncB( thermonuclease family)